MIITHCKKHWKTTLAGAVAAGCTVALPLVINGSATEKEVIVAFFLAAVGALCKDPSWL